MNGNNQLGFLDVLTIVSFCLQIMNVNENEHQSSNDDIMQELQTQDREFLETIVGNQKKIMSMLEKIHTA
jgi:hypothetical protein